jgi:HEAT repeat protein
VTEQADQLKAITDEEIEARLKTLLEVAKDEIFEEGVENEFSTGLISLINEYGADLVSVLAGFIVNERINEEIASEALRWLGRLDQPESYSGRLSLLEEALSNPSARIRDAASIGLATLGDPHAISYLKQALQQEACTELREDMQEILESLENAR